MRILAVALVLVGCDADKPTVLDAAAQPLSLDIVVTADQLAIRTNSTDQVCDCEDEMLKFAAIDTCFGIDDIIECRCDPPSCLAVTLSGTGVVPASGDLPQLYRAIPSPFPTDLVLELSGCGHPPLAIPIEPFAAPTPTLTVDTAPELITARWQTDRPAASAYVTFNYGIWAQECHTTAAEAQYGWAGLRAADYRSVGVTAFLPALEYATPAREVRIWRGAAARVNNSPM